MAFNTQKITTTNKTLITFDVHNHNSIIFTNSHATDAVTIDLYATSRLGTDITTTAVVAAESEIESGSSVTLTVDNGSGAGSAATDDLLLNERVYKANGAFVGICTTVGSSTALVFAGGIERTIVDNNLLYTGTRYYILRNVKIPKGVSLKLNRDEFHQSSTNFGMYINTDSSTGGINIIAR
tara:strand:- start:170 stop:715 length:546 start_codon:yes stop_codon:yes gene_type:complete